MSPSNRTVLRWLLTIFLCFPFVLAIIGVIAQDAKNYGPPHTIMATFSRILGAWALTLYSYIVATGARLFIVERLWGFDGITTFHKWSTIVLVVFTIAHVICSFFSDAARMANILAYISDFTTIPILFGKIVTLLILILSLLALLRRLPNKRGCLPRVFWKPAHFLFYVGCVPLIIHSLFYSRGITKVIPIFGAIIVAPSFLIRLYFLFYFCAKKWKVRTISFAGKNDAIAVIKLEPTKGDITKLLRPKAGQFFLVSREAHHCCTPCCPSKFWTTTHPMSVSSGPGADHIEFCIRKTKGKWTQGLSTVKEGEQFVLDGPYGILTPNLETNHDVLLVAGGVGIAPMMSIIRAAAEMKEKGTLKARVCLIYSISAFEDIVPEHITEIRALASVTTPASADSEMAVVETPRVALFFSREEAYKRITDEPDLLGEAIPQMTTHQGRITRDAFSQLVANPATCQCYLCGPDALMKSAKRFVKEIGIPGSQCHSEQFIL